MRKFSEELLEEIEEVLETEESIQPTNENVDEQGIPQYLYDDCRWLGYETPEIQSKIYGMAVMGTFSGNDSTVLDVGCGRGDFGHFIKTMVNPNIQYTGVDLNQVAIKVGSEKYASYTDGFRLMKGVWPDEFPTEKGEYDWVFHNTNLTLDYGVSQDAPVEYLKRIIENSLDVCNRGVVLVLLHRDSGTDNGYVKYSFDDVASILQPMGVKFAFDNTDFKNVFKVIIFNEQL